jgi:hypothetical protein
MASRPEPALDGDLKIRTTVSTKPLFSLGCLRATANALSTLASLFPQDHPLDGRTGSAAAESLAAYYFARHVAGDWGDLSPADRAANGEALKKGDRLFSSYDLPGGGRVWIITEWDRSATTLLLPEDY